MYDGRPASERTSLNPSFALSARPPAGVQLDPPHVGHRSCWDSAKTVPFLMRVFWTTFHDLPLQAGQSCRDGRLSVGIASPFAEVGYVGRAAALDDVRKG
jgi:hypothetical protein